MAGGRVSLLLLGVWLSAPAGAANGQSPSSPLTGAAAYGDWRQDAPGVARKITPADMPEPTASGPASTIAKVVERPAEASPSAPNGFKVELFASGLSGPRSIRLAPNGDIFIAETKGGGVRVFRPGEGGKPIENAAFASGLHEPYGLAFYPPGPDPRYLYVSTPTQVMRYPYKSGDLKASGPAEVLVRGLPDGGHTTRDLAFSPDGGTLFVAVGSDSNAAEGQAMLPRARIDILEAQEGKGASWGEELDRAAVLTFDPDGGHKRAYATGVRNCAGLTIRPGTGEPWCAVNERDMLGDDLPPDYATRVQQGAFYGWPWFYIGANPDPRHKGERPDLADKITTPDILIQPHSAPLGIAFYDGGQFPQDYKGDAFVALHGSWNRARRTGYKVVRLRFADGEPTGEYEDFLTGFVVDDKDVWGRPAGVAAAQDGSLLVSEDADGTVWRVSYVGNEAHPKASRRE